MMEAWQKEKLREALRILDEVEWHLEDWALKEDVIYAQQLLKEVLEE